MEYLTDMDPPTFTVEGDKDHVTISAEGGELTVGGIEVLAGVGFGVAGEVLDELGGAGDVLLIPFCGD